MSRVIKISKDMLNKAFREHYSSYCDESEFDEGFDDNIYVSYIDLEGNLVFENKEEIEMDEAYVIYQLFTEDLFEFIDVEEDYYNDRKVRAFKEEVEARFSKAGEEVVIEIA